MQPKINEILNCVFIGDHSGIWCLRRRKTHSMAKMWQRTPLEGSGFEIQGATRDVRYSGNGTTKMTIHYLAALGWALAAALAAALALPVALALARVTSNSIGNSPDNTAVPTTTLSQVQPICLVP